MSKSNSEFIHLSSKWFPFARCVVLTWISALYVSNCKPRRRSCGSFVWRATKHQSPAAATPRCWSWRWAEVGPSSATCGFGVPPVRDPWSYATKGRLPKRKVNFNQGEDEKVMPLLQFSLARSCRRSMCWELWCWAIHSRSMTTDFWWNMCLKHLVTKKNPGKRKKIDENSWYCTLQCIK